VITGAPSSGKTTVINQLSKRGHRVKHEVARAYIDQRLAKGETLEQIKADPLAFERHILQSKVEIEKRLPPEQLIFLDRAIPDSIAYFELEGLDKNEPAGLSRHLRYQNIFLFEGLEFEKDSVRWEDRDQAVRLETLLAKAYSDLGYTITRVPVMSVEARVDFVLRHTGMAV
jgi:predicted ATPase